MDKKDRLLRLIDHFSQGNKSQFAKMLGITPQAVTTWIARNTYDVDTIYAKCLNISPHWLLSGDGDMLLSKVDNQSIDNESTFSKLIAMIDELQKRNESISMQLGAAQERIRQLERERGQNASGATSIHANVG